MLRFKIVGIGRRPMLVERRTNLPIPRSGILVLILIVHLEPSIYLRLFVALLLRGRREESRRQGEAPPHISAGGRRRGRLIELRSGNRHIRFRRSQQYVRPAVRPCRDDVKRQFDSSAGNIPVIAVVHLYRYPPEDR